MSRRLLLALALALGPLLACGGGGGGGGGAPVPFDSSLGLYLVPAGPAPTLDPAGLAPESEYLTDPASCVVFDPALASAGRLPGLFATLARTRSRELTDAGPYRALAHLDPAGCGAPRSAALHPRGRSFAADAAVLELWTVERSTRAPGAHELDAWVPRDDAELGPLTVFVDGDLAHAVDAEHPFGTTELVLAGAADPTSPGAPLFAASFLGHGGVSQPAGFALYEATGDLGAVPAPGERFEEVQAAVELDPGGASGRARVFRRWRADEGAGDTGIQAQEWLFAFDAAHVLRRASGGSPVAFERAQPARAVWRYGLYEPSDGARVPPLALEGGFGVRFPGGEFGWYGPFGLTLPPGVEAVDGTDVVRAEFGLSEELHYTLRTAPGRLLRLTRNTLPLASVDGELVEWLEHDPAVPEPRLHRIAWDAGLGVWLAHERFDFAARRFDPLPMPVPVDVAGEGALALWSEALGGIVSWVEGQDVVAWYEQEVVHADDAALGGGAELELFGFVDALRAEITASEAESGDVFLPDAPDAASGHRFVFRASDRALWHDDAGTLRRVGLADGQEPADGPYAWGLLSGPLLPVNGVASGTPAGAWGEDVLYLWETGPNAWNRPVVLEDAAGATVVVELQARFLYVHRAQDDANGDATSDGRTFVLSFDLGLGLRGFPRVAVDLDGDAQTDRWIPAVSLADGTLVGPVGSERLVRGLECEEILRLAPGYAGSLTLAAAGDLVVPNAASVRPPSGPAGGAAPVPAEAPRVIADQLVGSAE